ncbi:MAG TPA: hypothetical protein VFE90_02935 [Myxococcales bacterium]|nr:hypothetical protein [Myxococcales bacterium]
MTARSLALSCIVLVACGGGQTTPPATSTTIGPLGGVVQMPSGPALNIVAGALQADTTITVRARSSAPGDALSTVYEFEPAGLTLARPATLSIPVGAGVQTASLFWTRAGTANDFDSVPAMVQNGAASATVDRLGAGYAGPARGAPRTVSGQLSTVYWADDGTRTTRPGAFGPRLNVSAVWIPAGPNYRRLPVSMGADSSFSAPGVPAGPYFLEVDTIWDATTTWAQLVEMSTSTPDLSLVTTARPDVEVASRETDFTLDLLGLTPWIRPSSGFTGDMLLLAGSQPHVYGRPQVAASAPPAGTSSFHATFDWNQMSTAQAIALPDASKGDVVFAYQRSSTPIGSGANQGVSHVASRFARLDGLTLHDGIAASASVTLADAPQTGRLRANLRNSPWAALLADANPATKPDGNQGVSLLAVPRTLDFPDSPVLSATTSLAWIQGPPLGDVDYGVVSYGQFLGAGWKEARYVLYLATADVPMPGTTATYPMGLAFVSFEPMPADDEIVPVLGPPRLPRIEGRDAFQAQSGVGLRPTLSWSPPRLGGATSYVVRIDQASGPPGPFASISLVVYGVTSVQVPDGLLAKGSQYAATISSFSAAWDKLDRPPLRSGMPWSMSDCVTAVFTP